MSRTYVKNLVHLVYSTKYRQPSIPRDIAPRLYAYQQGIFQEWESPALIINGVEDHVHALFSLSKNHALKTVVEEVKKASSKWMKTDGSMNPDFYWQTGYAAFSVRRPRALPEATLLMPLPGRKPNKHISRSHEQSANVFFRP